MGKVTDARRIVVLVVDDTDAAEDLNAALQTATRPPWKPAPEGENVATFQQERWDQQTADDFTLAVLKRSASKIHWVSSSLIPGASE